MADEQVDVLADNGHFDDIGRIAGRYAGEAAHLYDQVKLHEQQLGRNIRAGELQPTLRDAFRHLATRARAECRPATADRDGTLARQQPFAGIRLIGAEDITMAVWLAIDVEPAYLHLPRRTFRRINEAVAKSASREIERLPEVADRYYAVASAVDYNTAYDAGRVFATAGLKRAAMGFGAYMADDHYTDHVVVGRRRYDLSDRMPARYVRTALVARGFWDGYATIADGAPQAFHFLGLAAPIMLGLVALSGWGTPLLTFDGTSPIRDAVEGTFYVSAPAPLKVRTRRMARQLAAGLRPEWNCPCPFCGTFLATYPFDYQAGRLWGAGNPNRDATAAELRPGGALFTAYPLLSEPGPGPMRTAVNFTRMGHNHWALQRTTRGLNASSSSRERLASHVGGLVERYERSTNAPRFGNAVNFGLQLALGNASG